MSVYAIRGTTLFDLADAIRSKTGDEMLLSPQQMIDAINRIIVASDDIDGMIMRTSETIESNTASSVAAYAFFENQAVRTVVLPAVRSIGDYAFCDCANLERVATSAGSIGAYAFYGCEELMEFLFDNSLTEISIAAFDGCSALQTVNLRYTSIAKIMPSAFAASGVNELWLPEERFCVLNSANAFDDTPIGQDGSGGTIYVPLQYRVQYEANSVWSKILGNGTNRVVSY